MHLDRVKIFSRDNLRVHGRWGNSPFGKGNAFGENLVHVRWPGFFLYVLKARSSRSKSARRIPTDDVV